MPRMLSDVRDGVLFLVAVFVFIEQFRGKKVDGKDVLGNFPVSTFKPAVL